MGASRAGDRARCGGNERVAAGQEPCSTGEVTGTAGWVTLPWNECFEGGSSRQRRACLRRFGRVVARGVRLVERRRGGFRGCQQSGHEHGRRRGISRPRRRRRRGGRRARGRREPHDHERRRRPDRRGRHGRERRTRRRDRVGRVGHGLLRRVGRARERRLLPAVGHRLGRAHAHRNGVLPPGRKRRPRVRLVRRGHGGADHHGGARPRQEGHRLHRRRRLRRDVRGLHVAGEPLQVRDQSRGPRHDGVRRDRHRLGGRQPLGHPGSDARAVAHHGHPGGKPRHHPDLHGWLREREPARRSVVLRHDCPRDRSHQPHDVRHVRRVGRDGRAGTRRPSTGTKGARRRRASTPAFRTTSPRTSRRRSSASARGSTASATRRPSARRCRRSAALR